MGAAAGRFPRLLGLHRLLHMGRFAGRIITASDLTFRPCIRRSCSARPQAWFGGKPAWFPAFLPFSAALLILWAPGGFRFTCYYYRGAYYKAFWADPPNCAVGEPRKTYLRRTIVSADHSERPSLLSVSGADLYRAAGARRVGRDSSVAGRLPRRRRHAGARC